MQPQDKYVLRLPDGMRDQLKELARENDRSINAEIVQRLKRSIEDDGLLKLILPEETESALSADAALNDMLMDERAVQIIQANYGQAEYSIALDKINDVIKEKDDLSYLVSRLSEKEDSDFLLYYTKTIQLRQFVFAVLTCSDSLPKELIEIARELQMLASSELERLQNRHDRIAHLRELMDIVREQDR